MEILAESKTVHELLSNARYGIDYYQREYRWAPSGYKSCWTISPESASTTLISRTIIETYESLSLTWPPRNAPPVWMPTSRSRASTRRDDPIPSATSSLATVRDTLL